MFKNRKQKSRKGLLIFIVTMLGEMFIPFDPDAIPLTFMLVMLGILLLFIFLIIKLVNSISHGGKIFQQKLTLSTFQQIMTGVVFLYFLFLYFQNGNVQSVLSLAHSPIKIIIACFAIAMGAGFFEEYFVRGYLFNICQRILNKYGLEKNRLTIISAVTSIIFGLIHLSNLSVDPAQAVYQQVFYATCIGLLFAAIRIVTNNIFIGAILHFLFDFQVDIYKVSSPDTWSSIIIVFLPIAVISMILIKSLDRSVEKQRVPFLKP
ncbi:MULTISPECIES: CPBP family intramembrane glutamic endopeptidase [Leuconostoc]|nr:MULTISPECIES: CPBP family intramembrane glutamic endopeptidase [Leuconostoc]